MPKTPNEEEKSLPAKQEEEKPTTKDVQGKKEAWEADLLDKIPEENRPQFIHLLLQQHGPRKYPEFLDRLEPKHIADMIKYANSEQKNFHEYRMKRDEHYFDNLKHLRKYNLIGSTIIIAVFVFMVHFLTNELAATNPQLYEKVLIGLGGTLLGMIGGYGAGLNAGKKSKDKE